MTRKDDIRTAGWSTKASVINSFVRKLSQASDLAILDQILGKVEI